MATTNDPEFELLLADVEDAILRALANHINDLVPALVDATPSETAAALVDVDADALMHMIVLAAIRTGNRTATWRDVLYNWWLGRLRPGDGLGQAGARMADEMIRRAEVALS